MTENTREALAALAETHKSGPVTLPCRLCDGTKFYDARETKGWLVCTACGAVHDADDVWNALVVAE